MAYASNTEKHFAKMHGYQISESVMFGTKFQKANRRIWPTAEGRWQTADLQKGHYTNHKLFDELGDAIQRPL